MESNEVEPTELTTKYRVEPDQQYDLTLMLTLDHSRVLIGTRGDVVAEIMDRFVQEWQGTMWIEYYLLPDQTDEGDDLYQDGTDEDMDDDEEDMDKGDMDKKRTSETSKPNTVRLPKEAILRDSFIRFQDITYVWHTRSSKRHESYVGLTFLQPAQPKPETPYPSPSSFINTFTGSPT